MTACPRCGGGVAATQEYCLECGLRLPGRGRLGPPPLRRRSVALPLLGAAVVAIGAAGAAIAVTWEDGDAGRVLVATGGSERPQPAGAPAEGAPERLLAWPRGRDGWTIAIVSVPKQRGRAPAVARARLALERELPQVGIIDSDETAGLQPGYWVVFSGLYGTRPEATSDLLRARTVAKSAAVRRISG